MRSVLFVVALVAGGTWVGIRHVPTSSAAVEPVALPAQQIQSLSIDGRGLPLAALRAVISTQRGDHVDTHRLEADRAAVEAELAARGHLAARVEPASIDYGASGGAFVTFTVAQGPLFKLRTIAVTGATQRDAGVQTISAGEDAIRERIEGARQTLSETLARRGKPSTVTVAIRRDDAEAAVDVELIVTPAR